MAYPTPHSWAQDNPQLSIKIWLPIILCGRASSCTSTGSPAQNDTPSFWSALPSPPQLGPKEPPIVDQNLVAHHCVRSGSTLHVHREPCSEQQAQFFECPTPPPTVGNKGTPHCRTKFGCPSCCFVGVDAAPPHGALLRTTGPVFGLHYPPPHSWNQGNPHCRSEFGCLSCCAVGVHAAPPQGALLRTTGLSFGLAYPSPHSWAQGNSPLSIRIWLPVMLCGRARRCTSTGSPAENNMGSFWPALPSPPQLGPREPAIVNQNFVAHHAVRSGSTLHLHREPCSEQQAQFLACPTLPPAVVPKGTPHWRSEFGYPSWCAVGVDALPPQGTLCFVGRCQNFGKRSRQMQERMGDCKIRTAPRDTPHGRYNWNPFLSMQKLILTT